MVTLSGSNLAGRGGVVGRARKRKGTRRRSSLSQPAATNALLVPGYELGIDVGDHLAAEALPLLLTGAALHQAAGGRPGYPAMLVAAQAARALQHLGVDAELIPASAAIVHRDEPHTTHQLGVWRHEPAVRADGTTDGHVIIWSESSRRCLDLDIGRHRVWRRTTDDLVVPHPMIFPIVGPRADLDDGDHTPVVLSIPVAVSWWFFPSWTPIFQPLLGQWRNGVERGGLAAAHVILDMLAGVAACRDTGQMRRRFPTLDGLLTGCVTLPDIDADDAAGPRPAP